MGVTGGVESSSRSRSSKYWAESWALGYSVKFQSCYREPILSR